MDNKERYFSLILCISIYKIFSNFGVKIRISVFAESGNVWNLSKDFIDDKNDDILLLRLKDALCSAKRLISFPADAILQLKTDFKKKNINGKYIQVLISNLISPQVFNEKINWDVINEIIKINENDIIIVFGIFYEIENILLKRYLEENNKKFEELLNIEKRCNNVKQQLFDPSILNNKDEFKTKFENLISTIIEFLLVNNEGDTNFIDTFLNNNNFLFDNLNTNTNSNISEIENYIIEEEKNKENYIFIQNLLNNSKEYENFDNFIDKFLDKNIDFNPEILNNYQKNENSGKKNKLLEEIIKDKFKSSFSDFFQKNINAEKTFSSSGGSISIKAIFKNWICSGFTNPKIFEQNGMLDKRKYNLFYIIDLSKNIQYEFNYYHAIATILLLLIAPSTIDENEDIFINIIINSSCQIKIIEYNAKCSDFKNINKLDEIIKKINNNILNNKNSCCPGICLLVAYKLLIERRGSKKIFLITDNYLINKKEIFLAKNLMNKFKNEEIEFYAIGVGSFPFGLDKIYDECFYSSSVCNLHKCFSLFFNNKKYEKKEIKDFLINNMKNTNFQEFNFSNEKPKDKILEEAIKKKKISINDIISNIYELKEGPVSEDTINPEKDAYIDGVYFQFKNQNKILIIILYYGEKNEKVDIDSQITEEIFIENVGKQLQYKGLNYTIVYNYLDAIEELTKVNEEGFCDYIETWIFNSDGSGETPKGGKQKYYSENKQHFGNARVITKEDNEKQIIPFLETIAEYNKKGGALLLFCDNEPFVLETNLLLTKYLEFEKYEKKSVNFEMKGNYIINKKETKNDIIYRLNKDEKPQNKGGRFIFEEKFIESPGKRPRFSITRGFVKFHEGKTLSYAKKIDESKEIELFTEVAYLSDKNSEKAFVLYYDPKIDENGISRGPIVIHGGLTSAFYEFKEDGTGQFIKSIAIWLGRIEERSINNVPKIPKLERKIIENDKKFKNWIKIKTYTILIIDVSGSMIKNYEELVNMTNKIISNKKELNEAGTIILFGSNAKKIRDGNFIDFEDITRKEISNSNVGGGTNFKNAFDEGCKYLKGGDDFVSKKILFLTDGNDDSDISKNCIEMMERGFKIYFIGLGNSFEFKKLEKFPHNYMLISNKFEEIKEYIIRNSTT